MNKFLAKYCIYYPVQYLRGQEIWKYIKEFRQIQTESYEEILRVRDDKVKALIQHAYETVPYYRKVMDDEGISPRDIQGYDDLIHLPVLTKDIIRDRMDSLPCKRPSKALYERKTGGSTGMVLHFLKESDSLAKNDAIMYRCYSWYGIDIGDKQARFWGVPVEPVARLKEQIKDFILNRIRISAFDITEETCLREFERIRRYQPAYFYGYTTAIYGFGQALKKAGKDLKGINLKAVICTAEKMYAHHKMLFDEIFDCPVVDEYGSSENGIIAFQCSKGNMHIMSDHLAVEILDKDNRRVQTGELGKVVITDLSAYAMPLIRYEIGDMARGTEEACTCGINLPLMEIVEGRKEDFIRTSEGKMIHAAYLCYTLKDNAVHEFKMYQKDLNRLLVQIVKAQSFNSETEKKLDKKLRSALGNDMNIDFEYVERIPREQSGKLRYFVSEMS